MCGGEEVETKCEGYLLKLLGSEAKARDVMMTRGQVGVKGKLFQTGRYLVGSDAGKRYPEEGLEIKDRKGGESVEQSFEGDGRDSEYNLRRRRKISKNTTMI